MEMIGLRRGAAMCAMMFVASASRGQAQAVRLARIYSLRPEEGVFAYARISPDGSHLVYASQARDPSQMSKYPQTVTLVDLASRKVLFTERGIDAYFSTDGQRMIYSSFANNSMGVNIRHLDGTMARNVVPANLGDYYSWGVRGGRDLILTITSNYYYLEGDRGVMPASRVASCPGIGVGDRPLLSKDGMRITTFVRGDVVVRDLTDCEYSFDTGEQGAKADFSWDGRYIAFHVAKADRPGYDIHVFDLRDSTVRVLALPGSAFFPSWTRDGRICFRYDGDDYRGFMMASNILSLPARRMNRVSSALPAQRTWGDVFPESPMPASHWTVVLVWATWSAHSPTALQDLETAAQFWARTHQDVGVRMATDPGSHDADVASMIADNHVDVPRIPLAQSRLPMSEASNQMPVTMLFHDGVLVDRRLGAQTSSELTEWVAERTKP